MSENKQNCNVPNKSAAERFGQAEYAKLIRAFDHFNQKLFRGRLPDVMFTIARHRGAAGYFRPEGFQERKFDADGDQVKPGFFIHEIALMPDAMYLSPDRDVLSTLVHEMAHLEQQEFGTPSRAGYHNREWARMMKDAGLQASTLGKFDARNSFMPENQRGKEEGAESGQKVSHYIIKDGVFDKACAELLASGFSFALDSTPKMSMSAPKSKFKYTCPECEAKAWAKSGANFICGDCKKALEMEDEED